MASPGLHLSHRAQLALRYGGIALLGLVVFVFALQWTFPYNRVKDRLLDALADKYDASIAGVERGFLPGHFTLKGVTLRTRPDPKNATTTFDAKGQPVKTDEVPSTFYIDRIDIDIHLFPLLRMTGVAGFDIKLGPGHLSGEVSVSKSDFSIDVSGDGVPASSLPMREALGLPMSGKIDLAVSFDLPSETNKAGKLAMDWTKAEGEATFGCPTGCTFGDGVTRFKPKLKNSRSQAFAADGIDFGKVVMESVDARAEIKNGKLSVTKFETKSNDGELHVEYTMTLAPVLDDSTVDGCLRYNGTESLRQREPKTYAAIATLGGAFDKNKLYDIKLSGQFRDMRKLSQVCDQPEDGGGTHTAAAHPNLPPPPPEPPKPAVPVTAAPPVVPSPPPPGAVPPPGTGSGSGSAGSAGSAGNAEPAAGSAEGSAEGSQAPVVIP
jgi:type II secretion system protein N